MIGLLASLIMLLRPGKKPPKPLERKTCRACGAVLPEGWRDDRPCPHCGKPWGERKGGGGG